MALGLRGDSRTAERAPSAALAVPVQALGAETGVGTMLLDTMRLVATDVRGGVFASCGTYMPEEAPARRRRASPRIYGLIAVAIVDPWEEFSLLSS